MKWRYMHDEETYATAQEIFEDMKLMVTEQQPVDWMTHAQRLALAIDNFIAPDIFKVYDMKTCDELQHTAAWAGVVDSYIHAVTTALLEKRRCR